MSEQINWINARAMGAPRGSKREPNIDKEVSKLVGKSISATDPRLLKYLADKRKVKSDDVDDNVLQSESNREELKKIFD